MKQLLLLFGASLLPSLGRAQAVPAVRFGLMAGGALNTLVGHGIASEPRVQPLAGVVGGLVAQVPLTAKGHLFLQPEVLYAQEGYRLSHPSTNYAATLRASYAALPLLLGFTAHGFFAAAGPQLGYLVGVHERYRFQHYAPGGVPTGQGESVETDVRGRRRWETSLAAAVGYRFAGGLGVEARYTEALTSARGGSVFGEGAGPRNAGGQLRLSYLLP